MEQKPEVSKNSACVLAVAGDKRKLYVAVPLNFESAKTAILAMQKVDQAKSSELLEQMAFLFDDSSVRFVVLSQIEYEKKYKVSARVFAETCTMDQLNDFAKEIEKIK